MTDQWLPRMKGRGREEREGGITNRSTLLGVMAMFTSLIVVIISWVYEYVKCIKLAQFKICAVIICQP